MVGVATEMKRVRHQPNKSKLALYKSLLHFHSHLKQLYMSNETERLSYKGGCGMREHNVLRQLTEELAWATDKRFRLLVI